MKASLACLQLIKTTVALDSKVYSFTHALFVHFVTFITGLDIAVYEKHSLSGRRTHHTTRNTLLPRRFQCV